jgi:hypothetical protein
MKRVAKAGETRYSTMALALVLETFVWARAHLLFGARRAHNGIWPRSESTKRAASVEQLDALERMEKRPPGLERQPDRAD